MPVVTVHLWPHLSTLPCRKPPLPPPPRHLADTPLTPAASLLSAHSIHNPAGLWLYTLHRLCCLIFSIARCLYNINNPGPDDGNKVQSVEVRRVRAGFDLHNLLQALVTNKKMVPATSARFQTVQTQLGFQPELLVFQTIFNSMPLSIPG